MPVYVAAKLGADIKKQDRLAKKKDTCREKAHRKEEAEEIWDH